MTYEEKTRQYQQSHEREFAEAGRIYEAPFRIYGPLYYVGDRDVCVHLIDTGDGLLLIDAGFPENQALLVENIFRLGFDPKYVRWILHTHGHFDHLGASSLFRKLYGTELAISRVDAEYLKNQPETALGEWCATVTPKFAVPEEFQLLLEDGEDYRFGNVTVHCRLVPGHTPGVMAFSFDVTEDGRTLRAGLVGGVGIYAVTRPFREHFGLRDSLPREMLAALRALREEHVDIHLGNHAENNDTLGKREKQLKEGGNPFVDAAAWPAFLDGLMPKIEAIIEREGV